MKYFLLFFLVFIISFQNTRAQDQDISLELDNALSLIYKGDIGSLEKSLSKISVEVEKQAKDGDSDFKEKLLMASNSLKIMIPMLENVGTKIKQSPMPKLINAIKLLMGAHKLSKMLGGGGSLLTQAAGLKSNLGLIKMGSSMLGGKSDQMSSIIGAAMGGVAQLEKGGMGAKAAEPGLKKQLGSILDLAKGAL